MATYSTATKNGHRAMAWAYSLEPEGRNKPIFYVEGPRAEASKFFMKQCNVDASRLVAVNDSMNDCHAIRRATNGAIKPVHGNVCRVLQKCDPNSMSVVWLDLQCRTIGAHDIRQALEVAPRLMITLATRGKSKDDIIEMAYASVKSAGACLEEYISPYKGKSDVCNVIRLVCKRASLCVKTETISVAPAISAKTQKRMLGRVVRVPVKQWDALGRKAMQREGVKKRDNRFFFKIVDGYFQNRFALKAVLNDNTLHKEKEQWVIDAAQVEQFA
tara:strand:- start:849 stop:1667 length:819 start_codon:yes stop_codon:yes gene_type:complete